MQFQDHFTAQAADYAQSRPRYPQSLYDHLLSLSGAQARVWEAACGSGQATVDLAARFARVDATEPSAAALAHAPPLPRVHYHCQTAERCGLASASVDLIVVAQALHWFDQTAFFAECRRVLRPGGVLAVWCYQDFEPPAQIASICTDFRARIERYWPPQRRLIDQGYARSQWPFVALDAPTLPMTADWNLAQLLGYLRSFSAVVRCAKATGSDPVSALAEQFAEQWGAPEQRLRIHWPLCLHLRRRIDNGE